MKKFLSVILAMSLFGALLIGCSKEEKNEEKKQEVELQIMAAASMTDVMKELGENYKKENGNVTFTFNFGSSGTLQTQIEEGAPADMFISAATKQMDALKEKGLMDDDSIVNLLENKVVLIKPKDSALDIQSFEDVAGDKVSMVAIGGEGVPVGQYTQTIYENLGLWDKIKEKANLASDVRQVLDWTASKNVDCGIVYQTDAMIEENVEIVCEAPKGSCDKVIYPAGIVKSSEKKEEAEKFLEYIKSDEAKKVFEKYGFTRYEE